MATLNKIVTSDRKLAGGDLNPILLGENIKIYPIDYSGKFRAFFDTVKDRKSKGIDNREESGDFNPFRYNGFVARPSQEKSTSRILFGDEQYEVCSHGIVIPGWNTPAPKWLDVFASGEECEYFSYITLDESIIDNLSGWYKEKKSKYENMFLIKRNDPFSIYSASSSDWFKAGATEGRYGNTEGYHQDEANSELALFLLMQKLILGKEGYLKLTSTYARNSYGMTAEMNDQYEFISFKVKEDDKYPMLYSHREGLYGRYSREELTSHSYISTFVENKTTEGDYFGSWRTYKQYSTSLDDILCNQVVDFYDPVEEEYYDYDCLVTRKEVIYPEKRERKYSFQDIALAMNHILAIYKDQVSSSVKNDLWGLYYAMIGFMSGDKIGLSEFDRTLSLGGDGWGKLIGGNHNDNNHECLFDRISVDSPKPWVYAKGSTKSPDADTLVYLTSAYPLERVNELRLTLEERVDISQIFPDKKENICGWMFENLRYFDVTVKVEGEKRVKINLEDIAEIADCEGRIALGDIQSGRFTLIEYKTDENGQLLYRKRPFLDRDSIEEFTPVNKDTTPLK